MNVVVDFKWEPGENDLEYIKLLQGALERQKKITSKTIDKIKKMSRLHTFHVIDTTTGEEPDMRKIALEEIWAKHLMYCDMEGFALEEDGTLILLDECGRHAYCPEGRFKVVWDD